MKLLGTRYSVRTARACMLWLLAFAWLMVCDAVSSQTGEASGELSMSIARFLATLFHLSDAEIPGLNKGLRLCAHFVSFFVLSGLFSMAFSTTFHRYAAAFIWPLPVCVLLAFLDEIRKAGIPGRHCSIAEAWLNTLGCVVGFAVSGGILWVIRRRNREDCK